VTTSPLPSVATQSEVAGQEAERMPWAAAGMLDTVHAAAPPAGFVEVATVP
jgi:hypothetical protein